ncbi:hypothetical protein PybrP1_006403 [[Pythium] brassicae (nom. inval.)]|nr:hypothetical protein PybrP1_006403 [[Pythium] brassicae (nom. inval.)]
MTLADNSCAVITHVMLTQARVERWSSAVVSVGAYMASNALESVATKGEDLDAALFWDLARRVTMPLMLLFLDASDVVISNIGMYPYTLQHAINSGSVGAENLRIESVFVTATNRFNYAMMHKYERAPAQTLFAAYVGTRESLRTVATLVDKATKAEGSEMAAAAAAH